jgi:hypothetical protein
MAETKFTHLADRHRGDVPQWFDPSYDGDTVITIEPYVPRRMTFHIATRHWDMDGRIKMTNLMEECGMYKWAEQTGSQVAFTIEGTTKTAQLVQFEAFRQMAMELAEANNIKLRHIGYVADPGIGLFDL